MNQYVPTPVNTEDVEMKELIEILAKNTHDVWAKQRFEDAWVYGPCRDDVLKTNPCLVPYEELPESEKRYDRVVAEQTVKTILALGYRINP